MGQRGFTQQGSAKARTDSITEVLFYFFFHLHFLFDNPPQELGEVFVERNLYRTPVGAVGVHRALRCR